jgi:hypothetical protein
VPTSNSCTFGLPACSELLSKPYSDPVVHLPPSCGYRVRAPPERLSPNNPRKSRILAAMPFTHRRLVHQLQLEITAKPSDMTDSLVELDRAFAGTPRMEAALINWERFVSLILRFAPTWPTGSSPSLQSLRMETSIDGVFRNKSSRRMPRINGNRKVRNPRPVGASHLHKDPIAALDEGVMALKNSRLIRVSYPRRIRDSSASLMALKNSRLILLEVLAVQPKHYYKS